MNNIHFSIIAGVLFAANTLVYAGDMGAAPASCLDSGFYFGGNVGLLNLNDHESTTSPSDAHQLGAPGVNGGGMLGYDFSFNEQFKIGTEWFMNAVSNSVAAEELYSPYAAYTAKMRYEVGVRVLPRYALTPCTFAHLILGYTDGNFVINDNGNFGFIHKKFSQNGFQTGVGIMTATEFNIPLFFRADLIYSNYAAISSYGKTTSQNQEQIYNNNFSTIAGNLALIYQFS